MWFNTFANSKVSKILQALIFIFFSSLLGLNNWSLWVRLELQIEIPKAQQLKFNEESSLPSFLLVRRRISWVQISYFKDTTYNHDTRWFSSYSIRFRSFCLWNWLNSYIGNFDHRIRKSCSEIVIYWRRPS